jgi:general stress protein 26
MNYRIALLVALLMPSAATAQGAASAQPSRADIIAAARDVMQKARYCTFVSIGEDGHPQARIVDPLAPDSTFTIWFATNPLTRKVNEVRRNPRVTMLCFDAASSSYVTVLGRGTLVTDSVGKQGHWKDDWARIYPDGANGSGFMLLRVTPMRLEIVSSSRGMRSDPKTWLPLAIDFPPMR